MRPLLFATSDTQTGQLRVKRVLVPYGPQQVQNQPRPCRSGYCVMAEVQQSNGTCLSRASGLISLFLPTIWSGLQTRPMRAGWHWTSTPPPPVCLWVMCQPVASCLAELWLWAPLLVFYPLHGWATKHLLSPSV